MKRPVFLLMLAGMLTPAAATAAEEFEDAVPVDLARIFLGVTAQGGLYRDLPEDFPLTAVPANFAVLGSVEQQYGRVAYLETSLAPEEAADAIAEALAPAGWLRLPSPPARPALGISGFVDTRQASFTPFQFCHDGRGTLQVSAVEAEGREVLALREGRLMIPQVRSCRQQLEDRQGFAERSLIRGGALGEYMPRLELPREADFQGRPPGPVGGFSGGGDEMETRADLNIDWEPGRVYAHFEDQLAEQGWTRDGQWETGRVAGGAWTREADGVQLLGLLSIVRRDEARHHLRFRLMNVTPVRQ